LKPQYEFAQIIDRFGQEFEKQHSPNTYLKRTLSALHRCRTASLGGHIDKCDTCGHVRISYNSCRNRHCPKCQNTQREAWIDNRKNDLIPVPYFHVVFTVPDKLNHLFMHNPVQLYNLFFHSAWETIAQFSFTNLFAETGMFAILHTWGQNLSYHPHLHCVVPGGGIDFKGNWKHVKVSANNKVFLFNVINLSKVFRGKLIASLKKHFPEANLNFKELYKTNWVVYAKEPFAGPDQVIEYLGRYTHKVAISNHRILDINKSGVTFRWRDYRDNKQKIMSLDGVEFLRRFCQHILPKGFVRIRHFGLLSSTRKSILRELQLSFRNIIPFKPVIKKHWKELCREHLNFDPDICPSCKKGKMFTIERLFPGKAPPPNTVPDTAMLLKCI
jgi:hypothetical protein